MRLVFAGTPAFSVAALDALHAAGHEIAGVYTQPDRPYGRGRQLAPSAVAERAAALHLPVFKPAKLRGNEDALAALAALRPEVMVVVAYGLILPQAVLDIPRHGCLNIHASLLPRWRGAAPIQRAIQAGDTETGITIIRMDAGLDTGPMLLSAPLAIGPRMNAGELQSALAALGARLIVEALEKLPRGELQAVAQPEQAATYAAKISKDEARIDWRRPAFEIDRTVRAFNPAPVAWSELDGERVRIHEALPVAGDAAEPGSIDENLTVATGNGRLALTRLQFPGGKVLSAAEARQGRRLAGRRFT